LRPRRSAKCAGTGGIQPGSLTLRSGADGAIDLNMWNNLFQSAICDRFECDAQADGITTRPAVGIVGAISQWRNCNSTRPRPYRRGLFRRRANASQISVSNGLHYQKVSCATFATRFIS
jgi:hypothetical protein